MHTANLIIPRIKAKLLAPHTLKLRYGSVKISDALRAHLEKANLITRMGGAFFPKRDKLDAVVDLIMAIAIICESPVPNPFGKGKIDVTKLDLLANHIIEGGAVAAKGLPTSTRIKNAPASIAACQEADDHLRRVAA